MDPWTRFHYRRWYVRLVVKTAVFAVAAFIVCFPYPSVAWRHFSRIGNPDRLINPDSPALQPMYRELTEQLDPAADAATTLAAVQKFVREKIRYSFDWQVWGVADYLPTVEEVIAFQREDCDGQAVVAASLLRKLGFDAHLVANTAHVWVWTPQGETMGPQTDRMMVGSDKGVSFDWRGLSVLPRSLGFGIGVFPVFREVVLILVFWGLLMHPRISGARAFGCLLLLLAALVLLKIGGASWREPLRWAQCVGVASILVAIMMAIKRNESFPTLAPADLAP